MVKALPSHYKYILIDEIQKTPALLNVIQRLMKDKDRLYIMAGSSAKKLKHEGVKCVNIFSLFYFHDIMSLDSRMGILDDKCQ